MSDDFNRGMGPEPTNGLAIAALVLGIVSVLLGWIPIVGLVSWILAPLGLVLGLIALGKPYGRPLAIGGIVASAIGLLICLLWLIGLGALMAASASAS
ncbi:MAG: hypothetical protein REJ23_12310 [Brevundimonas sp.]|nr:hypothetical protein [Brevundimonas sp.]